jgi:predicted nucleic acid-binding protein
VIVIDASAAVLGLMNDGEARAMLEAGAVVCPHLADSEVVNTLRSQVLRGDLDVVVG